MALEAFRNATEATIVSERTESGMERTDPISTSRPPGIPGTGEDAGFAADGTDLTLIRWMLDMTPGERLDVLTNGARSLLSLRDGATEP